jgi:serine/threonine protein kinase
MLNHKSRQQTSYIPEPTIWYMFDSLAMAGLAMEQKLKAEPGQLFKAQELEEAVHLDIKPGNVFFGDYPRQDSISFAMYPTCKLGDFGSATYRGLALHPQSIGTSRYLERGTPRFLALEQKLRYYGQNRPPPRNAKTNVWGVGSTAMAFMNLDLGAANLAFTEAAGKKE